MPHTSLIDWSGKLGDIGQTYLLSWDKEDEVPIDHSLNNQYIIENEFEDKVAIRISSGGQPRIRVNEVTGDVIPMKECFKIAVKQIKYGYATLSEIRRDMSSQNFQKFLNYRREIGN
jgi:hypothetical protein